MPYFHDDNKAFLLGLVNGFIYAARKWNFAQIGSGRFLELRASKTSPRSVIRVEWLEMHIPFDPSILAVSRDIGVSTDGFSKYCFLPGSVGFDDAPLLRL